MMPGPYLMMRMPWDSFRARSRSGWLLWYLLSEPCCVERKREQISTAELGELRPSLTGRERPHSYVLLGVFTAKWEAPRLW